MTTDSVDAFDQLNLKDVILKTLDQIGYETPSPIQAQTIPVLLQGKDVVGQAQTGTGKTAAFALPILSNLESRQKIPQAMVLTPTRELAIQVAEAFQTYATHMAGFHVLPVYGGQEYRTQLRSLQRGVHVVVGTPGRVMDHMRRGTLDLSKLTTLVLDEADEMLHMGFIDDIEWILEQTPEQRQTALFSATMPAPIRRIASKHLNDPVEITIKQKTSTASTIRQRFCPVNGSHKLDALTRILEAEPFDAMLVFVRTKTATAEVSEKLSARGYASAALNGDIQQSLRERTVNNLKKGKLDIIVATDVAARGLDVERISHVINYDIPHDVEAYVHRIGRTGRAGRKGDAILFVTPREKRLLRTIERSVRERIEIMDLPSTDLINQRRIARFTQRITDSLADENLDFFVRLVDEYQKENDVPMLNVAAALAHMVQGDSPLLLDSKLQRQPSRNQRDDDTPRGRDSRDRNDRRDSRDRDGRRDSGDSRPSRPRRERTGAPESGMERYRIEVGHNHDVQPSNIVGAIANEAGLDSEHIGRIDIYDSHSELDLPEGMPRAVLKLLKKVWVCGQQLKISRLSKAPTGNKSSDATEQSNSDSDEVDDKRKPKARKPAAGKIDTKDKKKDKKKTKKKVKKKAATKKPKKPKRPKSPTPEKTDA